MTKEPCGYCGDVIDPNVICSECWADIQARRNDEKWWRRWIRRILASFGS